MTKPVRSENPYLLLTPGPLSTTRSVREAMLKDWCTWDQEYNDLVQSIRGRLVALATGCTDQYTAVLMQGSGTFCVESVIGSVIPRGGRLLVLANGAYGNRIAEISSRLAIPTHVIDHGEVSPADPTVLENALAADETISHVAVVHCETTTGILNPVREIGEIVKRHGRVFIVDAMSSFGGILLDIDQWNIDFLISSANKCIQGVPGFGFVLARTAELAKCQTYARSVSLDLYDQWATMEKHNGKWRFTSPTHVVRAFDQALCELAEEGGVQAREARYRTNQETLVLGMERLGFTCLLEREHQSPIITAFHYPNYPAFHFQEFYERLKASGFVIYPGKISTAQTFRIGNIGDIHVDDMDRLIAVIEENMFW